MHKALNRAYMYYMDRYEVFHRRGQGAILMKRARLMNKCCDLNEACVRAACVADKAAVTRDAAAELERLRGKKVPEANSNDTGASGS